MPATQADLDALNAALASGEKQVALGSQQVTYRSVGEIIAARNELARQIEEEKTTSKSRQTRLYQSGRGY